jgi:hypothetical protein
VRSTSGPGTLEMMVAYRMVLENFANNNLVL